MSAIYYRTKTDKETYFYLIPKQFANKKIVRISITERKDNTEKTYILLMQVATLIPFAKPKEYQLKEPYYEKRALIVWQDSECKFLEGFYLGHYHQIENNSIIEVTFND